MELVLILKTDKGISPSLHGIAVIRTPRTGLDPTGSTLDLFQRDNIGLQNDPAFVDVLLDEFAVSVGVLPIMSGYELHVKFETEASLTCFDPPIHRYPAEAAKELCRLLDVQVAIAVLIDVGLASFASHPATTANSAPEIQPDITFPDWEYTPHPRDQADGFFE